MNTTFGNPTLAERNGEVVLTTLDDYDAEILTLKVRYADVVAQLASAVDGDKFHADGTPYSDDEFADWRRRAVAAQFLIGKELAVLKARRHTLRQSLEPTLRVPRAKRPNRPGWALLILRDDFGMTAERIAEYVLEQETAGMDDEERAFCGEVNARIAEAEAAS